MPGRNWLEIFVLVGGPVPLFSSDGAYSIISIIGHLPRENYSSLRAQKQHLFWRRDCSTDGDWYLKRNC